MRVKFRKDNFTKSQTGNRRVLFRKFQRFHDEASNARPKIGDARVVAAGSIEILQSLANFADLWLGYFVSR